MLRPYTNISSLRIWDYYLKENFFGGPSFDRELFEKATSEDNEAPLMPNDRRIVDACYDTVKEVQLDQQRWQLEVGDAFLIGYVCKLRTCNTKVHMYKRGGPWIMLDLV